MSSSVARPTRAAVYGRASVTDSHPAPRGPPLYVGPCRAFSSEFGPSPARHAEGDNGAYPPAIRAHPLAYDGAARRGYYPPLWMLRAMRGV